MDAHLYSRMCRSVHESDSNRVWVHPSVAKGSNFCKAVFDGVLTVYAVGTDDTIEPSHFHLSKIARTHLRCDDENARVHFVDYHPRRNLPNDHLVLDLQMENFYNDEAILRKTYDADQLRCEMIVMLHRTAFEANRPFNFTHNGVVFRVLPHKNFVFDHDNTHILQLTHACNTCFNLCSEKDSNAVAARTPYTSESTCYY